MDAASFFDNGGDFKHTSFLLDSDVESLTDVMANLMPDTTDMDIKVYMDQATDKNPDVQMTTMFLDSDDEDEEGLCDTPPPNQNEEHNPVDHLDPTFLWNRTYVPEDLSARAPKPQKLDDPFAVMCKPVEMDGDDAASGMSDMTGYEELGYEEGGSVEVPFVFCHTFATPTSDPELREAFASLTVSEPVSESPSEPPTDRISAGPRKAKVPTFLAPEEWASVHPLGMKKLWKEHAEFAEGRKPASKKFWLKALRPSKWEARR